MSQISLTLTELKARVSALCLPPQDYAVFGSGPLLAHGLVEHVGDVDLLARGAAWLKATTLGSLETAPDGDRIIRLADGVDVFDGWLDMDTDAIIDRAVLINGLPFASLHDVLAFKRKLNRPKDVEHVRRLEGYLR